MIRYTIFFLLYFVGVWVATTTVLLLVDGGSFRWQVEHYPRRLIQYGNYKLVAVCVVCWSISWGALSASLHLPPSLRDGMSINAAAVFGSFSAAVIGLSYRMPFRTIAEKPYVIVFSLSTLGLIGFLQVVWLRKLLGNIATSNAVHLPTRTPKTHLGTTHDSDPQLKIASSRSWNPRMSPRATLFVVVTLFLTAATVFLPNTVGRDVVAPTPGIRHSYEYYCAGGFPASMYAFGQPKSSYNDGRDRSPCSKIEFNGTFLPLRFVFNWAITAVVIGIPTILVAYAMRVLKSCRDEGDR